LLPLLQVCPSLLIKKDRGRPIDPKARPKAYGEVNIVSSVPGVELLEELNDDDDDDDDDEDKEDSDDVDDLASRGSDDDSENEEMVSASDEGGQIYSDDAESEDGDVQDGSVDEDGDDVVDNDSGGGEGEDEDEDQEENDEDSYVVDDELEKANVAHETNESNARAIINKVNKSTARKRKFSDFDGQLLAADTSLRALKKMTEEKLKKPPSDSTDGILSNEDFQRIKELKVC
jgi:protein SDA1